MKGLDFKHFKKVAEDEHKATLKHADGHEIHIAKAALSKPMREQLSNIKIHNMAEGGQVQEAAKKLVSKPKVEQDPVKTQNAQDSLRKAFHFDEGGDVPSSSTIDMSPASNDEPVPEVPVDQGQSLPFSMTGMQPAPASSAGAQLQPEPGKAAPAQAQPDPLGYGEMSRSYEHGVANQMSGLAQEAEATAAQGRREAAAADQAIAAQHRINVDYNKNLQELNNERASFMQDVQNQHIDPSHYMESMSTGQKISTAIGLIAAGLTGGGAQASKFIENQIDRDINAQKAELGKKENLLSANMKQFGNLRDAVDMSRVMQADIMAAKMKSAAAHTMDPMAKARLLQEAGKLEIQYAPLLQQSAMRKAMMSGLSNVAPETKIQFVLPKEQHGEAYKEMKDAKANMKLRDIALGAFDQLDKQALGGRMKPAARNALIEPLTAVMGKELAGRYTEQDAKTFRTLMPEAGDSTASRRAKRAQLLQLINSKDNYSVLTSMPGIDLLPKGQYDERGQSRIQFTPTVK